jgi:hypothetical protein
MDKGSHGVSPVIQGQALAVSVVRVRTATPWLTAAVAWLRVSLTTALTFHSLCLGVAGGRLRHLLDPRVI